jgi:hypothetical protein
MMEKEILKELQEIKSLFARLIGSADQSVENRFSEEALNRAAKDFLKMSIERGDWVDDDKINKYIKSAPWRAGDFIRKEFAFANWFRRGNAYLYSKKDLIALNQELVKRNVDLGRYQEFLADKAAFDRKQANADPSQKKKSKVKHFRIPAGLKNITTSEIPKPDPEVVRQDLARLKQEFKTGKFEAYVDIYKGTHAMFKHIYIFQKYLEPGFKRRCQKWCEDFNYANKALKEITGKMEKLVVTDPTAIQL